MLPYHHRVGFSTLLFLILATVLLWPACSDDEGTTTPSDNTPPSAVTSLAVQSTTSASVTLSWMAPGDDGTTGRAASYDLRYAPGEPTGFVWAQATRVSGVPAPLDAGSNEVFTVTGLTSGATYTFALMTADEKPNWSAISNLVSATPGGGTTSCQVNPTTLAFGSVTVGSSSERDFTITNAGTQPLSGTVAESCEHFTIASGGGAYTLNGSETRTVTVRYEPSTAGNHACTIDTGVSGCSDVTCTGTGVGAPSGDMILIPAGPFTMGSDDGEGGIYERPEHQANLSAFYIDKYEVSNALCAQALNWAKAHSLVAVSDWSTPYGIVHLTSAGHEVILLMDAGSDDNQCRITWDGLTFGVESGWDNHPVVFIAWWGAAAYCNWRSAMEGKQPCYDLATWSCDFNAVGYRLATEAEWEKAARGAGDERTHPWGEGIDCDRCNYSPAIGLCLYRTAPVDDPTYADGVSPYGVWQMAGNVWEWCNDWYEDEYYASSPANDPRGPSSATGYRVSRGGSWWDGDFHQRCANRGWDDPVNTFDRLGFRTVLPTQATADCQVQPTALAFPETAVGSSVERTFTIANNGSGTLTGSVSESCEHFSLTTGDGSYSLGAGQSRTVTVRYAPSAAGAHSCTIETGASLCSDVSCTGTATGGAPGCTVNPTALNFPQTEVGTYGELPFVITNGGTTSLSGSVTESCAHFSIPIGGGAYTLAPGQQKTVVVRYEPASAGAHNCVVETGSGDCSDVTCTGTSAEGVPGCNVHPWFINFPDTPIGSFVELNFQIMNDGSQSMSGNVSTTGCGEFSVTNGGGAYTIGPGQDHTVTVRYAPTSHGTHTCVVETGTAACVDVACAGTSVEVHPECFVWPLVILNFSPRTVGTYEDLTFNLQCIGSGTLSGTVSESCEHYELVSGGGSYSLSPGQSRAVVVRYAPAVAGTHVCEIDTGTGCTNVGCTGIASTGGGTAQCSVNPTALVFPETAVGSSSDRSFTIRNSGAAGTVSGSATESCAHFSLLSGGGTYSLDAGEERAVTVRYEPTQAGSHDCTIDTGTSCSTVACSGSSVEEPGQCRVEPSALAFGLVTVGSSLDLDFTITNDGPGTLNGTVNEGCAYFSIESGSGSYSLGSGESRTVTIRYAPTVEGAHSCSVDLGSSCEDVPCTGTGGSAPEENMVLVPAGSFTMGSDEDEGVEHERPEHSPNISAFYMDQYEVTNAQYAEALNWAMARSLVMVDYLDPNGIVFLASENQFSCLHMDSGSDESNQCRVTWDGFSFGVEAGWEVHPVVYVTWWGAAAYCNWRSGMAGRTPCYDTNTWACNFSANGYRLPTEAEWEKAARGASGERTYPWGDDAITCSLSNYAQDGPYCVGFTASVDDPEYADGISPYGIWQLSGNVWEWCNDWYGADYYASSPSSDPTGPAESGYRISRGGSWWDGDWWQRCSARGVDDPVNTFDRLGLRTVRRP